MRKRIREDVESGAQKQQRDYLLRKQYGPSNPFERLFPPAADGRDLNPLLQNYWMVIHPPMLYLGYVGFTVPFAFGAAALRAHG